MQYNVIGLMSGSSLDGLDICFAHYQENRGKWTAEIVVAECWPYSDAMKTKLADIASHSVPEFLTFNTAYGRFLGQTVADFIQKHNLQHQVHFVASHGHTVYHNPDVQTSFQLGDGASIAAYCNLPVISDLRNMDVALNGQGAPIVPIGDKLLFGDYDVLINIGGIANVSIKNEDQSYCALDVTVANQALNYLAQKQDLAYDNEGQIAAQGKLLGEELNQLNKAEYLQQNAPKSLSNEAAMNLVRDFINNETYTIADRLHTLCHYIAKQIAVAIAQNSPSRASSLSTAIVTGGGAFNTFLMQLLEQNLAASGLEMTIPDAQIVAYKEALVMGLIGALRWREEPNVMASATGASRDSVGGAFWLPGN